MQDRQTSSTGWYPIAVWLAVIAAALSALILLNQFAQTNPEIVNVIVFFVAVIFGAVLPIGLARIVQKVRRAPSPVENPVARADANRLDQDYPRLPEIVVQAVPAVSHPPQWVRGDLIYELGLLGDAEQLQSILSEWKFATTSPTQPSVAVANGIIGIGHIDGVTFNQAPIDPISNCSVECELKIIDHGTDQSNWAGIRVRAFDFCYDLRLGYLVYLRRSGHVELYGPEGIVAGRDRVKVTNTVDVWTHIKIDILDSEIRVYVDREQEPHIRVTDKTFGGKGSIYLHTFGTHSQLRGFRVYALE